MLIKAIPLLSQIRISVTICLVRFIIKLFVVCYIAEKKKVAVLSYSEKKTMTVELIKILSTWNLFFFLVLN